MQSTFLDAAVVVLTAKCSFARVVDISHELLGVGVRRPVHQVACGLDVDVVANLESVVVHYGVFAGHI